MPKPSGWPLADDLSETMRDALQFYPNGHFNASTIKALRSRGLILDRERSELGERVAKYLTEKGAEQ